MVNLRSGQHRGTSDGVKSSVGHFGDPGASEQEDDQVLAQTSISRSSSTPEKKPSSVPSSRLVTQLRRQLDDHNDLMDDRFYISALISSDGDLDTAVSLIRNNQDFDLVDPTVFQRILHTPSATFSESNCKAGATLGANVLLQDENPAACDNNRATSGRWHPCTNESMKLSNDQKTALSVFQDLIYPRVFDGDVVVEYLIAYHWNVGNAFVIWELDRDAVVNQDQSIVALDTSPKSLKNSGILFNNNPEQERRDAARVFRDAVLNQTNLNARISISEAVLLLHNAHWNLAAAFDDFDDQQSARQALSEMYDHMRNPTGSRVDKDERLAILATITQRPDLWALEVLAIEHQWNLIGSIVTWYRNGVKPARHPRDRDKSRNKGWNCRRYPNGDLCNIPTEAETAVVPRIERGWAKEASEYVPGGSKQRPERPIPQRDHHLGSVINEDQRPVQKGVPRPSKLHFEAIWDGKYWQGRFEHNKYRWIDLESEEFETLDPIIQKELLKKKTFDWTNSEHLEDLNKWRRQKLQRATSGKIRPPSQLFSVEEIDYLYELSERHVNKLMKTSRKTWNECIRMDIPANVKQEWAKKFNDKFVGTMPHPHKKPIEPRNVNSLMTQRNRCPKIRDDFKLGRAYVAGRKRKRYEKNDSDAEDDIATTTEESS